MKEFRKTESSLFVCEECGKLCGDKKYLSKHVKIYHDLKEYYNKWLKEDGEGNCKICGKECEFIGFSRNNGYKPYCSKSCINKGRYIGTCLGNKKLYGVKNPFQRKDIKEKIKQINLKKYGVEYPAQSEICKNKQKQTFLKKYGVEHNMHDQDVFNKQQMSAFKAKYYKDTNICYRGSYELDFLEKIYTVYPDIKNGSTIKYNFENKSRIYFPDFYIPSLNLIIECKSTYYYDKFKKQCDAKKKAAIASGFRYFIVFDKDYNKLNLFLNSLYVSI